MKTPLPPGSVHPVRAAWRAFRRFGIVLLLFLSAFAHAVEAPTLIPNGGTFPTFKIIEVSGPSGAFLHYTTNGQTPQESDPIVSGGHVEVREPLTLKVIAIAGGVASPPSSADYVITGQVSTSGSHTLVLRADGTVWATGLNSAGQLGDGSSVNRILLAQVQGLATTLAKVVAVAAGGNHSLALKDDGTVWAWGSNSNLQCGRSGASSPTPTQVTGFPHQPRSSK